MEKAQSFISQFIEDIPAYFDEIYNNENFDENIDISSFENKMKTIANPESINLLTNYINEIIAANPSDVESQLASNMLFEAALLLDALKKAQKKQAITENIALIRNG
ncbi:hypothetical protein MHK_007305, partial [Candidatus Magnetomorum sp. HK-1]